MQAAKEGIERRQAARDAGFEWISKAVELYGWPGAGSTLTGELQTLEDAGWEIVAINGPAVDRFSKHGQVEPYFYLMVTARRRKVVAR